jgi:DNA repair protein RadC
MDDQPQGSSRAAPDPASSGRNGAAPRIRDMPATEKPRERLVSYGPTVLGTAELLAILLRTGRPGASALHLAQQLVADFGLAGLVRASVDELCRVPGCGTAKAVEIKAAIELGRRLAVQAPGETLQVSSPSEVASVLAAEMAYLEQEHLRVVLLNTKNHILGVHEVYKGSVNASLVRVGEIFREPVRRNCPSVIVAHNHPSGDPAPSAEDIHVTRQIVQAGKLLDIEVLDHIIIGHHRWVSLRERGLGFG